MFSAYHGLGRDEHGALEGRSTMHPDIALSLAQAGVLASLTRLNAKDR